MSKKIYINPGHSNTDPGAIGYETERELNVKVCNYQRDYLLANYDCKVRMNPGTMDSLYSITKDANNWGADLFVSNHFNAGGGDGYEALVYSKERIRLGEIFERRIKAIGQNSRGVKIRPDLAVLRDTTMPAILNEGAFVDNKEDIQDFNEESELKKLGEAYAKATVEFLSLPRKKKNSETTEKETAEIEKSYVVQVDITNLNIRKGPGKNYDKTGEYTGIGRFTIIETRNGEGSDSGWGRLKSGAGWISLDFAKRV